jgi:assimilatory nitrate reductase electron transfer subunit
MTRHVVVAGYGMAGARLVEELRARDDRMRITVLGAEERPAYNRVLLSSVLAGSLSPDALRLHDPDWAAARGIDVRVGTRATGVDREARLVTTDIGDPVGYDVLVLATGSTPWLPPTAGLIGAGDRPADGVVAFRTVADCEAILRTRGRIVVLGGGLLGLEAARGLAGRGRDVTVVHPGGHLMERQLDTGAGRVLGRTLAGLGVTVRLGVLATRYDPEARGLELDDGSFLPADLVVVATGVRPEVGLARQAGLAVEHGIVVDDRLRSVTDPRVRAIGECAEHRGTVHGLVAPAWEQATVVADLLTGADPAALYTGSRTVTRLKARDVDLAAMGDPPHQDDDPEAGIECISLADPSRGRYAKVVLRDDRVLGAIVLGFPEAAARLTQLYDADLPAPADRLGLLLEAVAREADSPAQLPDRAVVCRCNTVTKGWLTAAWADGARSVEALAEATRATTGCGGCTDAVCGIAAWLETADPSQDIAVGPRGDIAVGPRGDIAVGPRGDIAVGPRGDIAVGPRGDIAVGPRGDIAVGPRGDIAVEPRGDTVAAVSRQQIEEGAA